MHTDNNGIHIVYLIYIIVTCNANNPSGFDSQSFRNKEDVINPSPHHPLPISHITNLISGLQRISAYPQKRYRIPYVNVVFYFLFTSWPPCLSKNDWLYTKERILPWLHWFVSSSAQRRVSLASLFTMPWQYRCHNRLQSP